MENIERLELKLDTLIKSVENIKADVGKIKDSIYDPDKGLFIRVHNNTEYRRRRVKFDWLFLTISIGILINLMLNLFIGK